MFELFISGNILLILFIKPIRRKKKVYLERSKKEKEN